MSPDLPELTALYQWAIDQAMLSERQHQVLELWARGYGVKRTATALGIRATTVREHRRRTMEKLEAAVLTIHVQVQSDKEAT